MIVSRAGDWTAELIDNPPAHIWVRAIPAVEHIVVRKLFSKVVILATGSGIAPALGHLLSAETPSQLVWSTRDATKTYGAALVSEILTAQPDATIWNTDELGRPDTLRLAYRAYITSGAANLLPPTQSAAVTVCYESQIGPNAGIPRCSRPWMTSQVSFLFEMQITASAPEVM